MNQNHINQNSIFLHHEWKKSFYQNRFREIYEIVINIFYDAQKSKSFSNIRGAVKKIAVDSIIKPPLQNRSKESWKLCLNLFSRKWLRLSRSFVINLIPLELSLLEKLLADGLQNFRILFLKILKLPELLILWSSLFHSMLTKRKSFLKKYVLF